MVDVVIDMVGYRTEDAESIAHTFAGRTGQLVFCSTVDVCRRPATRHPYTEDEPYGGLSDYSINKIRMEQTRLGTAPSR